MDDTRQCHPKCTFCVWEENCGHLCKNTTWSVNGCHDIGWILKMCNLFVRITLMRKGDDKRRCQWWNIDIHVTFQVGLLHIMFQDGRQDKSQVCFNYFAKHPLPGLAFYIYNVWKKFVQNLSLASGFLLPPPPVWFRPPTHRVLPLDHPLSIINVIILPPEYNHLRNVMLASWPINEIDSQRRIIC